MKSIGGFLKPLETPLSTPLDWLEAESNCTLVMFFQICYFQDNIYPEAKVKFEAAVTAEEWFAGKDGTQLLVYNQKE